MSTALNDTTAYRISSLAIRTNHTNYTSNNNNNTNQHDVTVILANYALAACSLPYPAFQPVGHMYGGCTAELCGEIG